jgi:hypothetical protein
MHGRSTAGLGGEQRSTAGSMEEQPGGKAAELPGRCGRRERAIIAGLFWTRFVDLLTGPYTHITYIITILQLTQKQEREGWWETKIGALQGTAARTIPTSRTEKLYRVQAQN